jgi:hypothetical protein
MRRKINRVQAVACQGPSHVRLISPSGVALDAAAWGKHTSAQKVPGKTMSHLPTLPTTNRSGEIIKSKAPFSDHQRSRKAFTHPTLPPLGSLKGASDFMIPSARYYKLRNKASSLVEFRGGTLSEVRQTLGRKHEEGVHVFWVPLGTAKKQNIVSCGIHRGCPRKRATNNV